MELPESIKVTINGKDYECELRDFKNEKKGYGLYQKVIVIGDRPFKIMLNIMEAD